MMPMLMSMLYQACHDNLPGCLAAHAVSCSVLMVTGHASATAYRRN